MQGSSAAKRIKTFVSVDSRFPDCDCNLELALKRSNLEQFGIGSFPHLEFAPTIELKPEQFESPAALLDDLSSLGQKYGGIKLRPPTFFNPKFSLDQDLAKFNVRLQKIHRLGTSKKAFEFLSKRWTVKQLKEFDSDLSQKYCFQTSSKKTNHTIEEYEREYWHLIKSQSTPFETFYGADLEVDKIGSGFPDPRISEAVEAKHPWNLLNLAQSKGSLFRNFGLSISGVTSPWLYIGALFSTFCWHTEDDYLASVNYQHYGAPKIWYVVAPDFVGKMQDLMKQYFSGLLKPKDIVHSLQIQISPSLLVANNIPVHRIVQYPNEFLLLWPGAYHSGFNTGLNCNEACNLAPLSWLRWAKEASLTYRFLRPPCVIYKQLIYINCCDYETSTDVSALSHLYENLVQLIFEDYEVRKNAQASIRQLPLGFLSDNDHFKPTLNKRKIDSKLNKSNHKNLNKYYEGALKKSIDVNRCTSRNFLDQMLRLAHLPGPNCKRCYTSCYEGWCCCPHTSRVVCLKCIGSTENVRICSTFEEDQNERCVIFYRFPFYTQWRLKKLLEEHLIRLTETPLRLDNKITYGACEHLEAERSGVGRSLESSFFTNDSEKLNPVFSNTDDYTYMEHSTWSRAFRDFVYDTDASDDDNSEPSSDSSAESADSPESDLSD